MTTMNELNDSFESLGRTALRVKAERDDLLAAAKNFCTALLEECPNVFLSFGVAEKFMELRAAIIKAEQ